MKKIALINQRYGLEVNGGSEYYTRLIAEKLKGDYEVEVLTSKALSYELWEDYYNADKEEINGVVVRRFNVRHKKNVFVAKALSGLVKRLHINWKPLCNAWVKEQGPYVLELINYIEENQDKYDAFIFVTYMYYPTVFGMEKVKEKAIFIPTAHDEPFIYLKSHRPLFNMPRAIIYLTDEEKKFVEGLFHNEKIPNIVAGVGVDLPQSVENERFREKYSIKNDYLIYVGRVDKNKGCREMFQFFMQYKETNPNIDLVVMGQKFMDVPDDPSIHYLGFVSEDDKFDGILGAKALWLPSQFESLSISVLESMSLSVPVLVNGKCNVLKGHCEKSNGGLFYADYATCKAAMDKLLNDNNYQVSLGKNAHDYIENNYSWSCIVEKIKSIIEGIVS